MWITFKSEMCFIEWQDGPCSLAKTSQDNPLHSNEGEKCFLQAPLIPSMVLHELTGPYPSICLGFAGYFWAQFLHYQFLPFKNVAFFVFLCTAISSFTPLCFHLILKRAPRFLTPIRHVDLSQGRARKASWSMAVLGHRQKFQFVSISFTFNWLRFEINFI